MVGGRRTRGRAGWRRPDVVGETDSSWVEILGAVRGHGPAALTRARRLLQRLNLVQLDEELLDAAAALDPRVLRSLDAIHLAAAQLFGDELTAVVTYDRRMASAAGLVDLAVAAPR